MPRTRINCADDVKFVVTPYPIRTISMFNFARFRNDVIPPVCQDYLQVMGYDEDQEWSESEDALIEEVANSLWTESRRIINTRNITLWEDDFECRLNRSDLWKVLGFSSKTAYLEWKVLPRTGAMLMQRFVTNNQGGH